ncbi:MAG: ComEC/Rec2 family competence protein [Planctomycetota bacterium]
MGESAADNEQVSAKARGTAKAANSVEDLGSAVGHDSDSSDATEATLDSESRSGGVKHFVARYPLLVAAVSFVGGGEGLTQGANALGLHVAAPVFGAVAILSLAVYVGLVRRSSSEQPDPERRLVPSWAALFCFIAFFVAVGGYRHAISQTQASDDLAAWATREPKPIAVRCEITSAAIWKPNPSHRPTDPSSKPWMTTWEVECFEVQHSGRWLKSQARTTLATKGRVSGWFPGDQIECFGSFRSIYPATNPGAFDLAEHSAARGRFVMLSVESVEQVERLASGWTRPISRIRALAVEYCDRMLHRHVTNGQAPLAAALVFGQRQQVDWAEQQELMATGTLHMLAISGMHVEIVANGVLGLCLILGLGARRRFVLIACVCVAYALLADGKPPVLRATVLVLAFELARLSGRRARMTNMLSLAAIFLYALQAQNVSNVGVHLSFLAVAAIGVFVVGGDGQEISPFRRLQLGAMGRLPRFFQVVASYALGLLRLSFWVWIVTCPLVWYHFHVIAPVAIPLNVFVSVPLGLSLMTGLLTAVMGGIPFVSYASGMMCGGALTMITKLIDFGEAVPGGHFWLPAPSLWWITLFYVVLLSWLIVFRERRRRLLAVLLCILVATAMAAHIGGPRGIHWEHSQDQDDYVSAGSELDSKHPFAVTFLDVGHGTSVVIGLPDGRVWLYDAGHLGASDRSHQEIAEALWGVGTARIDTLILSHADSDHYNAVAGLAERFQIGKIWSTENFVNSDDRPVRELLALLEQRLIPIRKCSAGESGVCAGVEWKVLHPDKRPFESDNASSLCMQFEFCGKRVLLPGDLEGMGMYRLLELPERPCHALMAPHHGSLTKDPTEMLQWCRPELVVISGNHRAVRPEVIERYAPQTKDLAITFRDGAIRWTVDGEGEMAASRWRADHWDPIGTSSP